MTRDRPRIPIIPATAATRDSDRVRHFATGRKSPDCEPFDLQRPGEPLAALLVQPSHAGEPARAVASFDLQKSLLRLRGDESLFRKLVGFFLEDHASLMGQIKEGVAQADPRQIRCGAHTLKGMAANFDAQAVIAAAGEIETLAKDERLDEVPEPLRRLESAVARLRVELEHFYATSCSCAPGAERPESQARRKAR